jgi:glycosyltransferase involved in cell wall biosynthesis
MPKHAAITIVSKNYLAYARTLAESYLEHHPDHDFLVILVDRADGYVGARLDCGAEIIEIANLALPDVSRFIYRYSIMELNTAVKPFALADLFRRRQYDTLLYLDPDIFVFRPLSHVQEALREASIVLTPHLRRPYFDDAMPSDLAILQSGTYNLGFIGLKRGETAQRFLEWWTTKLHKDCTVDIPKGLFVDQKWVDMVPGFTPDHRILYEPGYNAAYWNLHERPLAQQDGQWRVGGQPLHFFHFSGYSPFAPQQLSKHQNRHRLSAMPLLRRLTDFYGGKLLDNGYADSSAWPYAFETLPNGVRLPLMLVNAAMQWAIRERVPTPCPVREPEDFCRFLMSRGLIPRRPKVVLLLHFLLRARPDVAAAFPNAQNDSSDRGLRDWVSSGGMRELRIEKDLLAFEDKEAVLDQVADLYRRLCDGRPDNQARLRAAWADARSLQSLVAWLESPAARHEKVTRAHAAAFKAALPGVARIVNIYFLRGDVHGHYPVLWTDQQVDDLVGWLQDHRFEVEVTPEEISLFAEFVKSNRTLVEAMRFLYLHRGDERKTSAMMYSIDKRRREIGCALSAAQVAELLYEGKAAQAADHFLDAFPGERPAAGELDRFTVEALDQRRNFLFLRDAAAQIESRPACVVNFAGYLTAPSGMGESARSMRRTLAATDLAVRETTLPHVRAQCPAAPTEPYFFGWPATGADLSITVANADAMRAARDFLPGSFHGRRQVAYWVWETEELPPFLGAAARGFDEIWTPSSYSAAAIGRSVGCPVRVLPHALDLDALDAAQAQRARFGLPESGVLIGFLFDPDSGVERKNVEALIRAFDEAFRKDDQCYLVVKVNGRTQGRFDYEMLRARTDSERVLFFEEPLTRAACNDFMASLDAYASLHRAEGFGLTCAEAMALGLPVVASAYSGNLDFMTPDNALLVGARVIETERPYGPYPAGTRWGDPDPAEAAAALRSLRDAELRRDLGRRGRESVRRQLAAEAVAGTARALALTLAGTRPAAVAAAGAALGG